MIQLPTELTLSSHGAVEAVSQYRFILGLLVEGQALWKTVSEEEKGSTFRFTFERKVKMHLIGASSFPRARRDHDH